MEINQLRLFWVEYYSHCKKNWRLTQKPPPTKGTVEFRPRLSSRHEIWDFSLSSLSDTRENFQSCVWYTFNSELDQVPPKIQALVKPFWWLQKEETDCKRMAKININTEEVTRKYDIIDILL